MTKQLTTVAPGADVFARLALKLREIVRHEQVNGGTGVERFQVTAVSPLRLEHTGGDLVLEDGDPDLTVDAWVRQYHANYGIVAGDQAWCLREGQEWHWIGVSADSANPWEFRGEPG